MCNCQPIPATEDGVLDGLDAGKYEAWQLASRAQGRRRTLEFMYLSTEERAGYVLGPPFALRGYVCESGVGPGSHEILEGHTSDGWSGRG